MKYTSLLTVAFFSAFVLSLLGCKAPVTVQPYSAGDILVAAHRAYHIHAPENSLESIRQSMQKNIDIVEIDVRRTADDSLVVLHDATIDRTTTGTGAIESLYWNDIKDLPLLHDGQPTDETIPLLREALRLGKNKILFDLDLKTEKIELVMQVVEQEQAAKNVFFFDSDWEVLEKVQSKHPDWSLMPRAYDVEMAKKAYEKFKPWAIHVDPSFASAELSDYFHSRGVHVWINALGDTDQALRADQTGPLEKLLQTKPSIIQTDLPLAIQPIIKAREVKP
ncbi:glycerophosphodiester phosphodiesterase family protein [Membranicola marinus]|uniref:Glycerophosphodiester phosphodiesterase family protein n=1 Tax=Membranihabitans marinus TaxID=1227546 RepID=A0A953HLP3_9BACT|nr:glycerophosphodiester phosphodiesterase family protein [Membranihabitans marinus]MBY5956798.1 glycerophosphodiester phosphodiesterase family protein [Membranihabitans marinus]